MTLLTTRKGPVPGQCLPHQTPDPTHIIIIFYTNLVGIIYSSYPLSKSASFFGTGSLTSHAGLELTTSSGMTLSILPRFPECLDYGSACRYFQLVQYLTALRPGLGVC